MAPKLSAPSRFSGIYSADSLGRIWMIVDAAFGPWRERVGWDHRKPGVTRAAISVVVLLWVSFLCSSLMLLSF